MQIKEADVNTTLHIDKDLETSIQNLLSGTETISQFCYKSTVSQVKRLEARNERARLQMMEKDRFIIEPIIMDVLRGQGVIE